MPTIVYLDTLPAQNGLDILHSQSKVEILKVDKIQFTIGDKKRRIKNECN